MDINDVTALVAGAFAAAQSPAPQPAGPNLQRGAHLAEVLFDGLRTTTGDTDTHPTDR